MENRKAFIVAGICFVISLVLIAGYVNVREAELTAGFGEPVAVVVATVEIPEYTIIRPSMVALSTDLNRKIFKNFRQPSAATRIEDVIGKSTYVPISQGEQVTLTKLIHQDGRPVLGRQVEQKYRAITVAVSPFSGVGRLIRPGNRIDVLAVPQYEAKGQATWEVKTVAQNVLVLATGRSVQNEVPSRVNRQTLDQMEAQFQLRRRKDFYGEGVNLATSRQGDNYKNITLQLTPRQSEQILFLTSSFGDSVLYFSLRNSADSEPTKVNTTLLKDVLGPDSDFARSQRTVPRPPPKKPEFYDSVGGKPRGVNPR